MQLNLSKANKWDKSIISFTTYSWMGISKSMSMQCSLVVGQYILLNRFPVEKTAGAYPRKSDEQLHKG